VYATSTKKDAKPACGISQVQLIREQVGDVPIVGIGGINEDRVTEVIQSGADGVAVITVVTLAGSPLHAAKRLAEKVWRASGYTAADFS
jgi:thiamine-phosphate pyrophosphorylase